MAGVERLVALLALAVSGRLGTCSFVQGSDVTATHGNNFCVISRNATKTGFHRNVVTSLDINKPTGDNFSSQVILLEHLPSGLYVDLFEIKTLGEFGGVQGYSADAIDIEKPEYFSSPLTVLVYGRLDHSPTGYHGNLVLPIHLRYHKPGHDRSFEEVSLSQPEVFLQMSDSDAESGHEVVSFLCHPSSTSWCMWKRVCQTAGPEQVLHFQVPVGDASLADVVAVVTLLLTSAGTCFLLYSIHYTQRTNHS